MVRANGLIVSIRVMSRTPQYRPALVWVLATLLLRAAIPDGYMPAQAGSGLLFKLCPSGVPDGFMMAIAKSGHQHHDHSADSGDAHYDASTVSNRPPFIRGHCC